MQNRELTAQMCVEGKRVSVQAHRWGGGVRGGVPWLSGLFEIKAVNKICFTG